MNKATGLISIFCNVASFWHVPFCLPKLTFVLHSLLHYRIGDDLKYTHGDFSVSAVLAGALPTQFFARNFTCVWNTYLATKHNGVYLLFSIVGHSTHFHEWTFYIFCNGWVDWRCDFNVIHNARHVVGWTYEANWLSNFHWLIMRKHPQTRAMQ